MVKVENVHKSFGKQTVLNGVSLTIEDGETVAIVGPSGVGKSVLLKLIIGIMEVDSGEIEILGKRVTSCSNEAEKNNIRKDIGVLFQSAALFDSLSIYDNVAFPLRERLHLRENEVEERVITILEELGLLQYARLVPEQISLGTRKCVALARCLVTEPKIVLFDEPNTGLDPEMGQQVYELIKLAGKEWGITGIVISHELPEVFQVSDRVSMLLGGNFVFEGTPEEMQNSDNRAVQQFLRGELDGPIKIQ